MLFFYIPKTGGILLSSSNWWYPQFYFICFSISNQQETCCPVEWRCGKKPDIRCWQLCPDEESHRHGAFLMDVPIVSLWRIQTRLWQQHYSEFLLLNDPDRSLLPNISTKCSFLVGESQECCWAVWSEANYTVSKTTGVFSLCLCL